MKNFSFLFRIKAVIIDIIYLLFVLSSTDQENLIFHILALPVHGAKYQFLVSIMNEEIDHTQTLSSATGSASFNKRSNFQFTYDSETNLLFLIHKYKEDIFTRGNIIKTWEKVLQEFNERCNSNIVQSRTINHRFQMLKKNLENRLKHNNQLLDQVVLNENEKLLVDILEYMYKNNHTEVNPYSLGAVVIIVMLPLILKLTIHMFIKMLRRHRLRTH